MDTNVAGLNKVVCWTNSASNVGKCVTISDDINTWSGTIANLPGVFYACIFMIPSMPAPAKKSYTVKLYSTADTTGSVTYSRVFELGFGDSVRIGLSVSDEIMRKSDFQAASSSRLGGVMVIDGINNGLAMSGSNIILRSATASQRGGVKIGTGLTLIYPPGQAYSDVLGLKELTRETATCTVTNPPSISGGSYTEVPYVIPSVAAQRLKRGFVEGVYNLNANYFMLPTISRISISSEYTSYAYVHMLYTGSASSQTAPSSVVIWYAYWS